MHKQSTLFPDAIEETRRCLYCEKPLVRRNGEQYGNFKRRRTCDRICGGKYAGQQSTAIHVEIKCEHCRTSFFVTEKLIEKRRREGKRVRFCSNACAFAFRRREPAEPKVCMICGETFAKPGDMPLSQWKPRRFCSRECRHAGHAAYWAERRAEYLDAGEKTCTKCGETKSLGQFLASPHHPDALRAKCTSCMRQEKRDWYWGDPEAARALARIYARQNPEAQRARQRRYVDEHRDELLVKWAAYRNANRDVINARLRRARAQTPREIHRSYNKILNSRPERRAYMIEKANEYRARKSDATVEDVRLGMVIRIHGPVCYLCDTDLAIADVTLDHVIPLSRGGVHAMSNVRPCCGRCNSKKGARLWDELIDRDPEMARRIKAQMI